MGHEIGDRILCGKIDKDKNITIFGDYAEMQVSEDKVTLIDLDDVDKCSQYNWSLFPRGQVKTTIFEYKVKKTIQLHRFVLDAPDGMEVDHINHDVLDNRKQNLRVCTHSDNMGNMISPNILQKGKTSKYKGVRKASRKTWNAKIRANHKIFDLGLFGSENEAAEAYNEKAKELFGDYAYLNVITDD